jgi:hypothetical protein
MFFLPPVTQSRTWRIEVVKVGPFSLKKWIPSTSQPTQALQLRLPKATDKVLGNKSKRRRTIGRVSIGSNLPRYSAAAADESNA